MFAVQANKISHWTPVTVDMSLEMTDEDFGPFGMVPFGGRDALQTLLVCLYLVQVT